MRRRRGPPSPAAPLLGGYVGGIVIGAVVLLVTAAGPEHRAWGVATADERFAGRAQQQGRTLPPGPPDPLVVSAARKVCDRRTRADTSTGLRRSALTPAEVAAVRRAFRDDSAAFLAVALRTYCPLDR